MVIKNVITAEEEDFLPKDWNVNMFLRDCLDPSGPRCYPIVEKILSKIREHIDFKIHRNSYCVIETRAGGHNWHCDTGMDDQMPWCTFGGTMLLDDEFTGGELLYDCKEKGIINTGKREKYDLWIHSSDEKHMVTSHEGNRRACLLFI